MWTRSFAKTTWMEAKGMWQNETPSIHSELLNIDATRFPESEKDLCIESFGWIQAILVDHDGMPWRQAWASRKQLQRGLFIIPHDQE